MIADLIRAAWAQSPGRVIAAIVAAPIVVFLGREVLVVAIVALS